MIQTWDEEDFWVHEDTIGDLSNKIRQLVEDLL
jgi:hypothetical protein